MAENSKIPDREDHNWLIVALAAKGDEEAIRAIQDCWAEIDRLRTRVAELEEMANG